MMKRRFLICLIGAVLMAACFCLSASAEVRGGHMPDVVLDDLALENGTSDIAITGPDQINVGQTASYTARGASNLRMAILGIGSTDPLTLYYEYISYSGTMTFSFYEPGTYYIYAWSADDSGVNSGWSKRTRVYGSSQLSQKITEIVSQCNAEAGTPYDRALWVHEYLTHNACYDPGYNFYGAGGVLLEGKGVCDSYSRAYEILMNSMGVDCLRQSGGNHSWNAVKMDDGEWYWVDCTWDDPSDLVSTAPVSGHETCRNFGLSDDLLGYLGHKWSQPVVVCTHMEYNYYVRTGDVSPWHAAVVASLEEALADGRTDFYMPLNNRYELGDGDYYNLVKYGWAEYYYSISAYLLDGTEYRLNGTMFTLRAVYSPEQKLVMHFYLETPPQIAAAYINGLLVFNVRGISAPCRVVLDDVFEIGITVSEDGTYKKAIELTEGDHTLSIISESHNIHETVTFTAGAPLERVLNVPAHTETIEEEAFAGLPIQMAVIPASCTFIDSRAFAGCDSLLLVQMSRDCEIASDAFEGCSDELVIVFWED